MSDPFFPVETSPIKLESNGQLIDSKQALIDGDSGQVVGIVGDNYKIVKNKDVADIFDKAFSGLSVYKQTDHLSPSHGSWVRNVFFNDASTQIDVRSDDPLNVMIKIFNSYDGTGSYGFMINFWRLVCTNGMVALQTMKRASFTHNTYKVDEIRAIFENSRKLDMAPIHHMLSIPFSKKNFETFLSQEKNLPKKFRTEIVDSFPHILKKYGDKENGWGAYNVLTNHLTHNIKTRTSDPEFSGKKYQLERTTKKFTKLVSNPIDYVEKKLKEIEAKVKEEEAETT